MGARDDIEAANMYSIFDSRHPFGIDRYREMVDAEITLGHMTVEAGRASGNLEQENAGKMGLGLRRAVDDEDNARLQSEIDAMWVYLRANGYDRMDPEGRA